MLSGYLVGGKLVERVRRHNFQLADYTLDRATRIFVPLFIAIPLTVACLRFCQGGLPPGYGSEVLGNIFQLQGIVVPPLAGNVPLWSLSYEVWFYVLGGSLAAFHVSTGPDRRHSRMVAVTFGLLAGGCLAMLDPTYLACWILGALIYAFPPRSPGGWSVRLAIPLTLFAVALCQATGAGQGALWRESHTLHTVGILLLGLATARLLPWFVFRNPTLARPGIGTYLSAFSYTLYLTHYPALLVLRQTFAPSPVFDIFSVSTYLFRVLTCLLVAWLLYLPFERRTPDLRHWLRRCLRSGGATA